MSFTVGILVLSTTKNRDFKTYEDTYLHNIFFNSFIKTYSKSHKYNIYIGYDSDDRIYSIEDELTKIKDVVKQLDNIRIIPISLDIEKGWVTKMWNILAKRGIEDRCDYLYQCGDDVEFLNKDWVDRSINILIENNNIGLTGPIDKTRLDLGGDICKPGGARFIMTQSFVSRKHIELFGAFFPEKIKNWFCDDYITELYKPTYLFPLDNNYIKNTGGSERYDVTASPDLISYQRMISYAHRKHLLEVTSYA